jgi:predicted Zn-dependent protease
MSNDLSRRLHAALAPGHFTVPSRRLLTWLAFCVVAVAPLMAGCGATRMSRSEEIELGQRAAAQIERQYRTYEDPTVSRIGQSVAAASGANYPYRFRVIDQDQVNAFALPGGPIYVTDRLLREIGDDRDQLAGVLGHEVAHVARRHSARQIERQNLLGLGIQILTQGTAQDIASLVANLELLSYSRDQEREADSKGVEYMRAAGYNPMGLVRFLERLARMEGSGGSVPFLRSHPGSAARADRLREMLNQPRSG